jgi:hypothetical protein
MNAPPPNPLLYETLDNPLLAQVLEGPTDSLARATRPAFLDNPASPVTWSSPEFERLEAEREDLLNWDAVEAQFDLDRYLRDGYAVFEGVMTTATVRDWTAALAQGQAYNDRLLQADWQQIDWKALGRRPPTTAVAREALDAALGGSQQVPQSDDEAGVKTLRQHSVFAEYFSAGHMPFIMNVLTHPQMLGLQRLCLGTDRVYFDHNQLLNRPPGYAGCAWHSHQVGGGHDDGASVDLAAYQRQPNTVLNLCYPQGFAAAEDAGLKMVRGSHLFRDPTGCRAADDEALESGWLQGRTHPVTGQSLQIERPALPPGSIVCCLGHAAHAVAAKAPHRAPRWCSLICYRKADDDTGIAQPPSAVPPVWAMKAQRGELSPLLTELLRPSFDRQLTGGRTLHNDGPSQE